MKRMHWFMASLACAFFAGCGIADKLTDRVDDLADDVKLALDSVKDNAKAAGGDAALVTAGDAATLEITDETSAIYGAAVELPADALPDGVTQAVVSIVPGDISGAGLQTAAAADSSEYTASGPAVEILLQSLPALETIQPAVEAKVAVPLVGVEGVTAEVTAAVGHFTGSDTFELLESTINGDGDRASANTPSFSPFAAVRRVVVAPPAPTAALFAYAITEFGDGSQLCAGTIDLNATPASVTYTVSPNAVFPQDTMEIFVSDGNTTFYYRAQSNVYDNAGLPASTPLDPAFGESGRYITYRLTCGDVTVELLNAESSQDIATAVFERITGFTSFISQVNETVSCVNTLSCARHTGTVRANVDVKFHAYAHSISSESGVASVEFDAVVDGRWDVVQP